MVLLRVTLGEDVLFEGEDSEAALRLWLRITLGCKKIPTISFGILSNLETVFDPQKSFAYLKL